MMMEKPGTRFPISYWIIIITLSVISFGVSVVLHLSSGILNYSRTITTKNRVFDGSIQSASRSQLAAVDSEREAGIIEANTTTTTTTTPTTRK